VALPIKVESGLRSSTLGCSPAEPVTIAVNV
jgi:hypothetical protein